eukprot:TRINITY_DN11173_c0_g1_i1.p1 TRINITY_DN11173_c0_g1~~TRINITY_DN11173_c0_g1_i1.p1  ORF type:complete len:965 (-),score=169.71 TRINITY_DN11173_c0_g1_i1:54-2948(-)
MDTVPWAVGSQILCNGKAALVQYVGPTHFREGIWVGVEFTQPAGRNDGSVNGVQYFGPTAPNRGLFVLATSDKLRSWTREEAAALKIQGQYRRARDCEAHQYAQTSKALNLLETKAESAKLRDSLNCTRTTKILQESGNSRPPSSAAAGLTDLDASSDVPRINLQLGQYGERPSVSRECLEAIQRHVKTPDAKPLRFDCVTRLVRAMTDVFRREAPCALREVALPPPPGRCVIVGDTHGQLQDWLWILFEQGEPSPENVYVVNGDVADRGNNAVEIFLLIFLFKLWCPGCIYVNRGNHEDKSMNEFYGFLDECCGKWGKQRGTEVYELFNRLFEQLPLFSLVGGDVFVVHGGLFRRHFGLAQLRLVDHRRPVPEVAGHGLDVVLFDSLWSDPQDGRGIGANPRGDEIVTFGPDVTRRFLKENKLRLIVRSHQCPDSGHGFEWHHDRRCLTIFSASNYCGDSGNLGSVLIVTQGEEDSIIEHWAPSLEELTNYEAESDRAFARLQAQARCTSEQRKRLKSARARMELDIVKQVSHLIVKHKTELFEYWSSLDESPRGHFCIPLSVWREGCAAVLDDSLPWVRLSEVMGVVEADQKSQSAVVHYVRFLSRYRVAFEADYGISTGGWESAVWSKLMETLLRADLPLREALAALDSTQDGLVSGVEFGRLLQSCNVAISPLQARCLLRTVVAHTKIQEDQQAAGDTVTAGTAGRASVWDVLGKLQVSLPITATTTEAEAEAQIEAAWAVPKLRALAAAVLGDAATRFASPGEMEDWPVSKLLAAWFEEVDASQNGYLDFHEFEDAMSKLAPALNKGGCPSDPASLHRIAQYCDVLRTGRINYFEFLNSLTWEDSLGEDLKADLMESIHAGIFFNMAPIRRALQNFDPEREGRITPQDCEAALRAVHTALCGGRGREDVDSLTTTQINAIARHLPVEADGRIDYERFLASFRVVDLWDLSRTLTRTTPF